MVQPRLSKTYARLLAEKVMELANLALGGVVFVQFVPGALFSGRVVFLGVLAFCTLHAFAYSIAKGGDV